MVHASLRAVGVRAEVLLEHVLDVIGPEGTLCMVLGADSDEPFDVHETEVDVEDMGVLAEVFRTFPGVTCSDHAAARWGAVGPHATTLLADPPLHDYHGPKGTLQRLVDLDGVVLRLGASPDTVTLTHLAEYLARVPGKRWVERTYVRADTGPQLISSLDDDGSFVEADPEGTYFPEVYRAFAATDGVTRGPVGSCAAESFAASHFVAFAVRWLEGRFGWP